MIMNNCDDNNKSTRSVGGDRILECSGQVAWHDMAWHTVVVLLGS